MHDFDAHRKNRDLISIYRSDIDAHAMHGFVLGCSRKLVVLQYVYDFNLDGLMVLRAADITEVRCTDTGKFQKDLLVKEGLAQKVPFALALDLSSWGAVIPQLAKTYALMILECEDRKQQEFTIGRVLKTTQREVHIHHFSGTAHWEEQPTRLKLSDITSCQVGTNYLNVYQRHFERNRQLAKKR